jgi:methyl-accepting chemotaxis protein
MDLLTKLVYGGLITSGLFALTVWFLTRYVKQRDDFETETKTDIKAIPEQIKTHVTDLKKSADDLRDQVIELKSHNLDFQKKVQTDLAEISRHTDKIELSLERSSSKASEIEQKLVQINERVQFHDKTLTSVVTVAKDLIKRSEKIENEMHTVKTQIGENLILIKEIKKKSDKA